MSNSVCALRMPISVLSHLEAKAARIIAVYA